MTSALAGADVRRESAAHDASDAPHARSTTHAQKSAVRKVFAGKENRRQFLKQSLQGVRTTRGLADRIHRSRVNRADPVTRPDEAGPLRERCRLQVDPGRLSPM